MSDDLRWEEPKRRALPPSRTPALGYWPPVPLSYEESPWKPPTYEFHPEPTGPGSVIPTTTETSASRDSAPAEAGDADH